jgi:hypothetical protein
MTDRRGFVKTIAVGSAAVASAGSLLGLANPLLQNVSTQMSDGKSKYGKCLVKLPIRKMGDMSMFSAGADILNGFPCNIIYAFGIKVGPLGMSTEPHIHDHDEVVYFIGSDPKNIGDLGAEVNFKIGPKHCPMVTMKFQRPFLCMAVSLTTKYEFHYADKKP